MSTFVDQLVAAVKPELDKAEEYRKPIMEALHEIISALCLATGTNWRLSPKLVYRDGRLCAPIEAYRVQKTMPGVIMRESCTHLCCVHVPLNGWPVTVYQWSWDRVAHNKEELFEAILEVVATDEGRDILAGIVNEQLWAEGLE
jgi:hypothetical protein